MIDQIAKLFRICYPDIIRAEDSIRHTVAQEDNKILTRFDGDKLIGAAVYYDDHILLLCVLPEYRGKGIFRKRLEEVIGDTPCVLIPENDSLFAFYEKFGFKRRPGEGHMGAGMTKWME